MGFTRAQLVGLTLAVVTALPTLSMLAGCAGGGGDPVDPGTTSARITALSAQQLGVGDQVFLAGEGFVPPEQGWVDVRFVGTFTPTDGAPEQVDRTVALQVGSDGFLRWDRFGAYRVPFGAGDRIGTFQGKVYAINRYYTGEVIAPSEDAGFPTTIEVRPSLVLMDMRAIGEGWVSDCKYPSTTALNNVNYLLRFRAVGFEPRQFDYTLGEGFLVDGQPTRGPVRFSKPMLESEHSVLVHFAPVPQHTDGFKTSLTVQATASNGTNYRLEVPIIVRRPLQLFFVERMQIAQIFEPQPVSGCIPGGQVGLATTYSESTSETRSRTVTDSIYQGFNTSYNEQYTDTYGSALTTGTTDTIGQTTSVSDTRSMDFREDTTLSTQRTDSVTHTTSVDFSQSSSSTFGVSIGNQTSTSTSHTDTFNREVGGGGGGSLFGVVELRADGKLGWVDSDTRGVTNSRDVRRDMSNTTTTSMSRGESLAESTSITEGVARSFGTSYGIAQTYSEANSFTRSQQESVTDSYSAAESRGRTLGEMIQSGTAVAETVSTTETTSLATMGNIPALQNGVWYRQTTRLVRRGVVVAYDLCGNGTQVGTVTIDDWAWAPNLAIGPTCPPEPDLPPAQCFIEPCSPN